MLDEAITQIPARYRRDLLITLDGAGAAHGLVKHITALNVTAARSALLHRLGARRSGTRRHRPGTPPRLASPARYPGKPRDLTEAGVVELTVLLREHPDGYQLANWPTDLRIIARRENPARRATSPFEAADR